MRTSLLHAVSNSRCFQRLAYARLLLIVLAITGVSLTTMTSAEAQNADNELKKSIARKLRQDVIPPLLDGNDEMFQSQLAKIISKIDPKTNTFEQIEAYGQATNNLSLKKAFFEVWKNDVSSGRIPSDIKMRRPIALFLASSTTQEIEAFLTEMRDHDLVTIDKLPSDWRESRDFFLAAETVATRRSELQRMGQFVNTKLAPHVNPGKLKGEAITIVENFQSAAESFAKTKKLTEEKEAVLRLQRLNTAAAMLDKPGDFEMKFISALFIEEDAAALESFFNNASPPDAEELKRPGLVLATEQTINDVRSSGNPVIEKTKLFAKGLNQWKRGRYGSGALANGLLKTGNARSIRGMLNRASDSGGDLWMPENPIPISQFLGSDSGPGYDRRHYYTWDLEYRAIRRSYGESSGSNSRTRLTGASEWTSQQLTCTNGQPYTLSTRDVETQTTNTQTDRSFVQGEIDPQDDSIPPRIVGTLEYSSAIAYLEKLISLSDEEEIEVYDKVIAQLPEFTFYSGMTAGVKQPQPTVGNNVAGADPQDDPDGQFRKQSLAWMLALAKVELNATRSMYWPGDKAFIQPAGTFGLIEYYHVLLDDVAAHLQAIETDDEFKKAIKKFLEIASSDTVAYLRRLKLISSMLIALEQSGDPMIAEKSAQYHKKIDAYNTTLEAQVAGSLQKVVITTTQVTVDPKQQGRQSKIQTH